LSMCIYRTLLWVVEKEDGKLIGMGSAEALPLRTHSRPMTTIGTCSHSRRCKAVRLYPLSPPPAVTVSGFLALDASPTTPTMGYGRLLYAFFFSPSTTRSRSRTYPGPAEGAVHQNHAPDLRRRASIHGTLSRYPSHSHLQILTREPVQIRL